MGPRVARSGKSPKLTSEVLGSRDATLPSDLIIAIVGYDNRNSQRLLRLADLSADGNNASFSSRRGYTADFYRCDFHRCTLRHDTSYRPP